MAYAVITLTNDIELRDTPIGFSWTTLFFGGFVPLCRKDWPMALLMFVLALLSSGWTNLAFPFFYNLMYARALFTKGFKVSNIPNGITRESVLKYLGYIKFPNE